MKKLTTNLSRMLCAFMLCVGLLLSGCYDDSDLRTQLKDYGEQLGDHESRLNELERLCSQTNTNIESLQALVEALQKNEYVTSIVSVTENGVEIGYTITFSSDKKIIIYHGKDGKDGAPGVDDMTPIIGVAKDTDGVYYWTVNGSWLVDEAGAKIPTTGKDGANGSQGEQGVVGVTPQFKIENGQWLISYDNGATWTEIGQATGNQGAQGPQGEQGETGAIGPAGKDSIFSDVYIHEDYVYFVLSDGTTYIVPMSVTGLNVVFNVEQGTPIVPGAIYAIKYTIVGGDESTIVRAFCMQKSSSIVVKRENAQTGTIYVSFDPDPISMWPDDESYNEQVLPEYSDQKVTVQDSYDTTLSVIVSVSDGRNNSILKSLNLTEGIISSVEEAYWLDGEAGEFTVGIKTNVDYQVRIPSDASWLSLVPATKASVRYDEIPFRVEENSSFVVRTTQVKLVNELEQEIESFTVAQRSLYEAEVIKFADDNVMSACVDEFDANSDGVLTKTEAASVTSLKGLKLPKSITSFDELKYFTAVSDIENDIFTNCTLLKSIILPPNLKYIWRFAFYNTGLVGPLVIPPSVEEIMHDSFAMCPNLNEVHFLSEIPVFLGSGAFDWHTIIYVPDGCYKAYFEECGYEYNWADTIGGDIEFTSLHMFGKACDAGENIEQTTPFQYQDGVWVWEGDLTAMDDFKILLQRESGLIWPCLIPNAKGTQVFYAEENSEIHSLYDPYKVDKDGYYRVVINTDNGAMHISYLGSMKSPVRELYLLGDAVDSGWSLADMPAFENNNGVFTWTGHLKANSQYRFPIQRNWWPCLCATTDGKGVNLGTNDNERNHYPLPESGVWTITVDLTDWNNRSISFELVEADYVSYTVAGTIVGDPWNNTGELGLMTKEGDYYVAKNLPLTWSSNVYADMAGRDFLEFKICETGSWNMYYQISSDYSLPNTPIEVLYGYVDNNIKIKAPSGNYDVYFDKNKNRVWVMTPGYSPDDKVPLLSYVSE